jgi:hypothetical protein
MPVAHTSPSPSVPPNAKATSRRSAERSSAPLSPVPKPCRAALGPVPLAAGAETLLVQGLSTHLQRPYPLTVGLKQAVARAWEACHLLVVRLHPAACHRDTRGAPHPVRQQRTTRVAAGAIRRSPAVRVAGDSTYRGLTPHPACGAGCGRATAAR